MAHELDQLRAQSPRLFGAQFSEASQAVIDRAKQEAVGFKHPYIGSEHLLLGLLQDSSIAATLAAFEQVNTPKVRNAIEFIIGSGERETRSLEYSAMSMRIFELSIDEARRLEHPNVNPHDVPGQTIVDPDHILLGLIREGSGIAIGVLESLGVSFPKVQDAIKARRQMKLEGQTLPQTPQEAASYIRQADRLRAFLVNPDVDETAKRYIGNIVDLLVSFASSRETSNPSTNTPQE